MATDVRTVEETEGQVLEADEETLVFAKIHHLVDDRWPDTTLCGKARNGRPTKLVPDGPICAQCVMIFANLRGG